MKRLGIVTIIICLVLAGCSQSTDNEVIVTQDTSDEMLSYDIESINQTLNDWMLGTEYGVEGIELNIDDKTVEVAMSEENYAKLEQYELDDIAEGITGVLNFYDVTGDYFIAYSNGDVANITASGEHDDSSDNQESSDTDSQMKTETTAPILYDGETLNMIFIHHSVGANWLNAGLNEMLNENNIHIADTYYGWREMGDRTDTWDWPDWFNDDVMPTVYNEHDSMTGNNSIDAAAGENTIIMFKSCYPNSDVGDSIEDEKQIYLSLLDYFEAHPDKMFVLVTPPPMQSISHPDKTRELCNWLVAEDGWRNNYSGNNLYVFDLYNVLTAPDNHHMLSNGAEEHIINDSSNTLYYDSSGDDHPNDDGSYKAAEEFVPLLMHWYGEFSGK